MDEYIYNDYIFWLRCEFVKYLHAIKLAKTAKTKNRIIKSMVELITNNMEIDVDCNSIVMAILKYSRVKYHNHHHKFIRNITKTFINKYEL